MKLVGTRRWSRMCWSLMTMIVVMLSGCDNIAEPLHGNAMYYWKTTFRLDSAERDFLKYHKVQTLYVRFFDVIQTLESGLQPNATIAFEQSIPPGIDIVPVIFIVNECMTSPCEDLAERIADRVTAMCAAHDLNAPKEIQIDCDWTASTRKNFFSFLEKLNSVTHARDMRLSVTVRLHQLNQSPPRADYGVLMAYNTGDYRTPSDRNPILDRRDVEPYLPFLKKYKLPLCAAYPIFSWPVLYGRKSMQGIVYGVEPDSMPDLFVRKGANEWVAVGARNLMRAQGSTDRIIRVTPGMRLRIYRAPRFGELMSIEKTLQKFRPGINDRVVLYDLDKTDLNNYTSDEYDKIFAP